MIHQNRSSRRGSFVRLLAGVWVLMCVPLAGAAADTPATRGAGFDESAARTLFAFDDVSIPFSQNLRLEMRTPTKHPANPIVNRGKPGEPDSWAVQFYGSVIKVHGKYRMWYCAAGEERLENTVKRSAPWMVAYAESDDGVKWTKPHLGLVEYRGNRNNNLCDMNIPPLGVLNLKVLHEPEDPNPQRRYKMTAHVWWPRGDTRHGTLAVFASPDGLTWKSLTEVKPVDAELTEKDMLLPMVHFEPCGGLYKWDGIYYATGQNAVGARRPFHARISRSYASGDFVNWTQSSAVIFVRTAQHQLLGAGRGREGEQTHEGISVWNRGNVLLGVSGLWHGGKEWPDVTIDLGFVISNDGLHFREPAHDWAFIKRGQDKEWDQGGLIQGQGFEQVGDETFIYYGAWDPRHWEDAPRRGGVGIATVPRDRFADLVVETKTQGMGDYQAKDPVSEFITSSIPLRAGAASRFFVNADGPSDKATLTFELLAHDFKPLPGFSGKDAAVATKSGFHTPLTWSGQDAHASDQLPERVRVKATFGGAEKEKIRFSALYVQ